MPLLFLRHSTSVWLQEQMGNASPSQGAGSHQSPVSFPTHFLYAGEVQFDGLAVTRGNQVAAKPVIVMVMRMKVRTEFEGPQRRLDARPKRGFQAHEGIGMLSGGNGFHFLASPRWGGPTKGNRFCPSPGKNCW